MRIQSHSPTYPSVTRPFTKNCCPGRRCSHRSRNSPHRRRASASAARTRGSSLVTPCSPPAPPHCTRGVFRSTQQKSPPTATTETPAASTQLRQPVELRGIVRFGSDLRIDLLLMVEIISQRGMDLTQGQRRVLPAHLFRGPAVGKVVHRDLRDTDAGH